MSEELKPPPVMDEGEPEAIVERIGRWTYSISIEHGLMHHGDWRVWGWERAMRRAQRELQRYRQERARQQQRWVVTDDLPRPDVSGNPPKSQVLPKGPSGISPSRDGSR